jgi:beta-glucosidase
MTDTITYGPYHGYTLLDKKGKTAAFPFGFGGSYTTFSFGKATLLQPVLSPNDTLQVLVNVTNTGPRAGEEVVQLYIGFENAPVERPKKLLRGFEKINLQAGEMKAVRFQLPAQELAYYDVVQKKWVVAPGQYAALIGSSSRDEDLQRVEFEVR